MDVTALLLVEPGMNIDGSGARSNVDHLAACTGSQSCGLLPVLGRPLVFRLMEALALAGIRRFTVVNAASALEDRVTDAKHAVEAEFRDAVSWNQALEHEFWQSAEEQLVSALEARSSVVLIVRANAYFELGSAAVLTACAALPFARLQDSSGDLDAFWVAAKSKAKGIDLLRARLQSDRAPRISVATYANRLSTAADLRRLTDDAFNLRLAFRPSGREIRPGVWTGEGARIHRSARVVAPAYIGDQTKIRAAALVTRGSSIEHHCEVDCGTVVQAANVLPFTYVGAGLELVHAVAGRKHIASAAKKRTSEIIDPKLLNEVSGSPAVRMMESAARLASFLPIQLVKGFFGSLRTSSTICEPDVGNTAIATRIPAAAETALATGLATTTVTRDHGNE